MNQPVIIHSELFDRESSLQFGMSTRIGGVSPEPLGMNLSFNVGDDEQNVRTNRALFFDALDIPLNELALQGQVHSTTVKIVEAPGMFPECDALITHAHRVFLCVSIADCVPVFVFDKKNRVVAGIHAGWRGTAGKIVGKTLEILQREFSCNPVDLLAYIGPAASACCYSVGEEVASQFDGAFVHCNDGRQFVDLKSANRAQLLAYGVGHDAIEISPLCTITEPTLHSYRRDKERSGRMMGVIGIR
jgi:polyphenol oxidase